MRILPVLDLLNGRVVRAVAGRREQYRPVVSRLTPSSAPLDVARAFRDHLGLRELYIADLDAIEGRGSSLVVLRALVDDGFALWVDGGLCHAEDAAPLFDAGVAGVVAGLETLAGPDELSRLCAGFGERVVFSLDLRAGSPLGTRGWQTDPWEIATEAVGRGVRRVLLLDLARVGTGEGTGTEDLCRRISGEFPDVEVWSGGGVSGVTDLERLREGKVGVVLIASALHDGRITREMIEYHARVTTPLH